ncbi:hypothetical protein Avbf_00277 [Armadillidium vulgare]|nr:hypothetical protein Avbf_00277 [Armadillidium vulgare]
MERDAKTKLVGLFSATVTTGFTTDASFLRHLRDLGMGKSKIEGLIMREVEDLVEEFKGLTKESIHSSSFYKCCLCKRYLATCIKTLDIKDQI